jgi:hypothetical protein
MRCATHSSFATVCAANKMFRILHVMWVNKEGYDSDIATGGKLPNLSKQPRQRLA